ECRAYRVEQYRGPDGLLQKSHRPSLERAPPGLVVPVSRQDDDWDLRPSRGQVSQQVQAVHPGHAHVEHQATNLGLIGRLEKGLRGLERLDTKTDRHQKVSQRATKGRVVVHDADHLPVTFLHRLAPIVGSPADPRLPYLRRVRTSAARISARSNGI